MKIAICLKEDECEVTEFEDAICLCKVGVEIGYLKINPDRIPSIVASRIAEEEMAKRASHIIKIDVCGDYMVLADDRAIICTDDVVTVLGTAYIVRKQAGTYTGLSYDEIDDWIYDFEDDEIFSKFFPNECPKGEGIRIPRR